MVDTNTKIKEIVASLPGERGWREDGYKAWESLAFDLWNNVINKDDSNMYLDNYTVLDDYLTTLYIAVTNEWEE